ncbi:MAG: SMC-Scp complex subunit ScpB [Eubacteriales bacterium]|nr:SMC-Scp complex subunit ScpB [Eubacteriales bacterium]
MKSALESMLFVWGDPLPAKNAGDVFGISQEETEELLDELMVEYEERGSGIQIRRINASYQLVTKEENADFIRRLATPVKVKKLSQAALEVLAIIAYKQPVTKAEMEAIRGTRCDRVVDGLEAKGLVRECGRSTGAGRPVLYGTTDKFLEVFGFSDLSELPSIDLFESDSASAAEEEDSESDQRQLHFPFGM